MHALVFWQVSGHKKKTFAPGPITIMVTPMATILTLCHLKGCICVEKSIHAYPAFGNHSEGQFGITDGNSPTLSDQSARQEDHQISWRDSH